MYYTQSVSAPFKFSYLFLWMIIKMLLRNLTTCVTDYSDEILYSEANRFFDSTILP